MYNNIINDYKDIWVFAEQRDGIINPVVFELLGEGKKLSKETGSALCAIVLGHNISELSKELFEFGAEKIYLADSPLLKNYSTDGYTKVISDALKENKPEIVLYGATHIGRDLAPRIAARVDTGLTADCTDLQIGTHEIKNNQLIIENKNDFSEIMIYNLRQKSGQKDPLSKGVIVFENGNYKSKKK